MGIISGMVEKFEKAVGFFFLIRLDIVYGHTWDAQVW